jgi:hypothetical protein
LAGRGERQASWRSFDEAATVGHAVQVFRANGREHDIRAGGGTCFGDSGGPALLNGYLVGNASHGDISNCPCLDGYQRVDIESIQTWLATFPGLDDLD